MQLLLSFLIIEIVVVILIIVVDIEWVVVVDTEVIVNSQHQRKGTVRGRSAPSLTSGLWNSRPGRVWICAQHVSQ